MQMAKVNLDCHIYGAGSFVRRDINLTGHHTDFKRVWRKSDAKMIVFHHRAHSCGEGDGELLHERGEEEEKHHPGQVLSETQPPTYETGRKEVEQTFSFAQIFQTNYFLPYQLRKG